MKKVGIVTLCGYYNLGNKLQNYALTKVLEDLGCQVETLFYQEADNAYGVPQLKEFANQYLHEIMVNFNDHQQVKNLASKYDAFLVGSDQVWNFNFTDVKRYLPIFFLQFAPSYKRISYAASFGIKEIAYNFRIPYIQGLTHMQGLSVREQEGAEIIRSLCGEKAHVHVDPTMLLTAEDYKKLARSSSYLPKEKFVAINVLRGLTDKQITEIGKFCVEQKCAAIDVNYLLSQRKIGVEEFLYAILHAEYVFTDSFHCTVFSILFHRPFLTYAGNSADMFSRISTLLDFCGLEQHVYHNGDSLKNFQMDFDVADRTIPLKRQEAFSYLRKALGLPTKEKADIVPNKEMCCGCGACMSVCPMNCIAMQPDKEGFLYPHIDSVVCVGCNKCKKVCPAIHPILTPGKYQARAAVNLDEAVRKTSSSGGIFSLLAEATLKKGGVVFGAAYGERFKVSHQYAETLEDLEPLKTSKYVQSDTGDTFRQAKNFLEQGRQVFYTGTPCQIQGLKSFLGRDYVNLLTADLVCHGTSSPEAWDQYLTYRERMQGQKVIKANFRSKEQGWHNFRVEFQYEDGTIQSKHRAEDPFCRSFLTNENLRKSCYQCPFHMEKRCSDLTMGDFWGVETIMPHLDDDKGTSLLLVYTPKGQAALEEIQDKMTIVPIDNIEETLNNNICAVCPVPWYANRAGYFDCLERGNLYV